MGANVKGRNILKDLKQSGCFRSFKILHRRILPVARPRSHLRRVPNIKFLYERGCFRSLKISSRSSPHPTQFRGMISPTCPTHTAA